MDTSSEPGDFEFQDNQDGEAFDNPPVEEIDAWEPIKPGLDNPDIQSSGVKATSGVTHTEEVDAWKRVSDEAIRQMLVHQIMRLLDAWVISGLLVFIVTGNAWLLTTAGLLGLLLRRIFDYYFRRPKK